ncbi:uncharacterized protein LOC115922307 [Strongylocentrotus purpuratus]|uniref:SRCR domain-containing protein n=1 Tax=Strongylocentrotus purpuratus TaxID=7668 RepID=A0A7M7SWP4_STRPU|nr:uncharacterized protein LOC115922307 [Strongylocentrotus purpuratus]
MLGFDGALGAPLGARFGKGSGSIFLDKVQCQGTETDIERCDHDGIGVHNCSHNEDASVICIPKGGTPVHTIFHTNLTLTIIIGLCVFLSSVFLVATLAYCVRRTIKTRASRNSDSYIHRDTVFTQDTDVSSTYQDLNAPPKLPERRLKVLTENRLFEDERKLSERKLSVLKTPKGENTHDYMETTFISKTASSANDARTDAVSLPVENTLDTDTLPHDIALTSKAIFHYETCEPLGTVHIFGQNDPHEYMVMNTVYKTIKTEKEVDIDGYLLPSKTSGKPEPPCSVEKKRTLQQERTKQDLIHKHVDIKTICPKSSSLEDVSIDEYVLPSAVGHNNDRNRFTEDSSENSDYDIID